MSIASACLTQTIPDLKLSYPQDAKEHLLESEAALKPWIQEQGQHCFDGYCGPWIENHWISHFGPRFYKDCVSDTFGPFVPLFVPCWVDLWVGTSINQPNTRLGYPAGFTDALANVLRPDVAYITASQNYQGLLGNNEIPFMHNVLVLSAGGLL
jgi:hypothetical protein